MDNSDTVFHKIIRREIPADIVFEDELLIAFRDVSPVAKTHLLIVPKKNLASMSDVTEEDTQLLGHMLVTASKLAKAHGVDAGGYRLAINTGAGGGQSVFQLHLHLIGGRTLSWPPG